MSTYSKLICDVCNRDAQHAKVQLMVIQTTEETEGRSKKPCLKGTSLDLCQECLDRIIDNSPLLSAGAQGYNNYSWRTK